MRERPAFTQLAISADSRPMSRGENISLWIIGIVFCGILAAAMVEQFVPQKLSIVFFVVLWALMLAVHELGHAAIARLLGWHVAHISIGFGPQLWSGRVGRTQVSLRLLPIEGYVLPAPSSARGARWKSALIYAAGPGAELAILFVLMAWLGVDTVFNDSSETHLIALKTLAIVIIWGAGFNLIPFATNGGVSDGLGILLSPFMTRDTIEQRLLTLDDLEVDKLAQSADVDAALEKLTSMKARGVQRARIDQKEVALLADANRYGDARLAMDQLLDGRAIIDLTDVGLLHLEALVEMRGEGNAGLTTDLALNRARRLAPEDASLNVTRGIADILQGQAISGGNRIADAYRSVQDPYDRARALGYLYVAATRCHDTPAAERFFKAFQHVNRHALLETDVRLATDQMG